jgi:hypothetical protein
MKPNKGKRNLIEEIEELKNRHGGYYSTPHLSNWQSAVYEIERLSGAFQWGSTHNGSSEAEQLLKYVPVGLIATVEVFFRNLIGQLIDFGSPYVERVRGFDNIRFDVDYMVAIPQKRVSVGEFVSHQLKINNLNNIQAYMRIMTDQDFWNSLKNVVDRESGETILKDAEAAFQSMEEMFRMRHIIAHETNFYIRHKYLEIEKGLTHALEVVNATGEFAAQLMNLPVTIDEKLKYAEDKLADLKTELASLAQEFKKKLESNSILESMLETFEAETKAWEELVGLQEFEGYLMAGTGGTRGHGNDLAVMDAITYLTQVRVNSLKFRLTANRTHRQ